MFRWPVPATMLIDDAVALVREVAAELRGDPTIYPFIWSPMELQGVESFDNGQAVLRFRFKTAPLRQWEVQRAQSGGRAAGWTRPGWNRRCRA